MENPTWSAGNRYVCHPKASYDIVATFPTFTPVGAEG